MLQRRMQVMCLSATVVAFFLLSTMGVWGRMQLTAQASPSSVSGKLDKMSEQHEDIYYKMSAEDQHMKDIDRQLAELNQERLSERMTRLESGQEANQKFLIGILGALLLLVIEAFLRHATVLKMRVGD